LSIVDRVPVEVLPNEENAFYLQTKAERMGHEYAGDELAVSTGVGDIAKQLAVAPTAVIRPERRGIGMAPPPREHHQPDGAPRDRRPDDPVAAQAAGVRDEGRDRA
jgi:hypothetical protein